MYYTQPAIIPLPHFDDTRGALGVIEASKITGFDIRRVYYLYGSSPQGANRGFHAHKELKQLMLCVAGQCTITLEGEYGRKTYSLSNAREGLIVPAKTWREVNLSPDAFLIVFSSEEFSQDDYIRDYDEFKQWLKRAQTITHVPYLTLDRCHDVLYLPINRAIADVIDSGTFIGGAFLEKFETEFATFCDAKYAIGCANGLDALILILSALGIGRGDEVIVPVNSFIATALAVERVGATSVLVDCDENFVIDPARIESVITKNTKAIIPVHLYGIPAQMGQINAIAKKYNLQVIEDAAQAHGAKYQGRKIGSLARAAAFSFYPTKNLGALGDAGAVVTNDEDLAHKVRMLGNYGSITKYQHETLGVNSRLDPLQASVLSLKLKHLEKWNERRAIFAQKYIKGLKDLDQLSLVDVASLKDVELAWHVFPVRVKGEGQREKFCEHLRTHNIGTNIHYPKIIQQQTPYKTYPGTFENAELMAKEIVSLPLDAFHTELEIDYVIDKIQKFYE